MDIKYMLYGDEVKDNGKFINSEEVVKMSIMKVEERMWYNGEMMIYEGETEEADPVELLGPFGNPHDAGKYFVKLLKMMPTSEDDE